MFQVTLRIQPQAVNNAGRFFSKFPLQHQLRQAGGRAL